MSLNALIIKTLKSLNVPVAFQNYNGSESTYIRFFEYNQNGALYADDEEVKTGYFIQIDVFSMGDYTNLVKEVKKELKAVGFIRSMETESYENDTKTYHKVMRFNFVQ